MSEEYIIFSSTENSLFFYDTFNSIRNICLLVEVKLRAIF